MDNAVEIQQKVLQDARSGKDFTVVTEHGDIEFDLTRISRQDRQRAIKALPDALIEQMNEQSDEDKDTEFDLSELEDMDDLSETNPESFDPDAVMTPEAVDEFENIIGDSLSHPSLSRTEIIELFAEGASDKVFYATGFIVIAFSAEASGVERFRTQ